MPVWSMICFARWEPPLWNGLTLFRPVGAAALALERPKSVWERARNVDPGLRQVVTPAGPEIVSDEKRLR